MAEYVFAKLTVNWEIDEAHLYLHIHEIEGGEYGFGGQRPGSTSSCDYECSNFKRKLAVI